MKLRDPEKHHWIPPIYGSTTKLVTLCLHYGGVFDASEYAAYLEGSLVVYDFCELESLSISVITTLLKEKGVKSPMRLYCKKNGGFVLINKDCDLHKFFVDSLNSLRECNLFCEGGVTGDVIDGEDEVDGEDGNSSIDMMDGEDEVDGEDGNISIDMMDGEDEVDGIDGIGGDGSIEDFEDSDYDMEEEPDDDELFDHNIDMNAEWLGDGVPTTEDEHVHEIDKAGEEDVLLSDDDLVSCDGSGEDNYCPKFPVFNQAEVFGPTFQVGMLFGTKDDLRKAIHSNAIECKRNVTIVKNDKLYVRAKCKDASCGWKLNAVKIVDSMTYKVIKYTPLHTCASTTKVKNVTSTWLAAKFQNKFQNDPNRGSKGFQKDCIDELKVHVSLQQAYRSKKKAIAQLDGTPDDQYQLLWDYCEEVRTSNPGSTVLLGTDETTGENLFDRFYICLHALKEGFKRGYRPLIGVDGCFLKGPHEGVLLTAVGVDPNNNLFPIAYAVVGVENKDSWSWFLHLLKKDLDIEDDHEWTFISDKQKGLIAAMHEIFPNAEHRFCARHLHENWKKAGFRGQLLKHAFWLAAKACTVNEFRRCMAALRVIDEQACEWFNDKPPHQWSRSHFKTFPKCDMLLNNACETFHGNILPARHKPILSMLQWIMEYLMKRMQKNRDNAAANWSGTFCPKIQEILDKHNENLYQCIPIKANEFHFQIECANGEQFKVNLKDKSCGCRKWDLRGIPCIHAVSAIQFQGLDLDEFVDPCYRTETYKKVYEPTIMPTNGRSEWTPTGYLPPLPPNFGRGPGRPTNMRRREPDEIKSNVRKSRVKPRIFTNDKKIKRQQNGIKCSNCKESGHNKRSCPLLPSSQSGESSQTPILSKLQVRKSGQESRSTDNVVGIKSKARKTKPKGATTTGELLEGRQGPSMYQQFQQGMKLGGVKIIEPPRVVGQFIPSQESCITQRDTLLNHIFSESGKKYSSISSLVGKNNEPKHPVGQKQKGKAPM